MLPVLPVTLLLAWIAERARERQRPLYLHGTAHGPFKTFRLSRDAAFTVPTARGWGHGVLYFSSPDRSPGRKTQAEHIGEGPFGGWIASVHLGNGKLFDPLNDPEAAAILQRFQRHRPQGPSRECWWIIEYTEAPEIVGAAIEHGYNRFEIYEPSVQGWSTAIADTDLIEIVAWHRWDGTAWKEVDANTWWKRGVERIVDTAGSSEHDWGMAAVPVKDISRSWMMESASGRETLALLDSLKEQDPGIAHRTILAQHVTDNPHPVVAILQSATGDLASGRTERELWGDIGPGLYASDAPQIWMGRSTAKWAFLSRLDDEEKMRLVEEIRKESQLHDPGYLTPSEMEHAHRLLDGVERGTHDPGVLLQLASQPYNILFWRPSFLAKIGISPGPQPEIVPVVLQGRYAEMERSRMPEDLYGSLRQHGIDGAYTRSGFAHDPQVVTWDKRAIVAFNGWTQVHKLTDL